MSSQWYYGNDGTRIGPFTEPQLKELAASGGILETDTIWKEGVEKGAPAGKIKNLFSRAVEACASTPSDAPVEPSFSKDEISANVSETLTSSEDAPVPSNPDLAVLAENTELGSQDRTPKTQDRYSPTPRAEKKGKATGVRGVFLIAQDGETVRYKKKCVKCGYLDLCASKMAIKSGTIRGIFFCPKCRKTGEVVMQCNSSS